MLLLSIAFLVKLDHSSVSLTSTVIHKLKIHEKAAPVYQPIPAVYLNLTPRLHFYLINMVGLKKEHNVFVSE